MLPSHYLKIALAATLITPLFHAPLTAEEAHRPEQHTGDTAVRAEYPGIAHWDDRAEESPGRPALYLGAYAAGTITINSGMDPAQRLYAGNGPIGAGYDLHPAAGISLAWLPGNSPGPSTGLIARILYDNRSSEQRVPAGEELSFDGQGNRRMLPMTYWSTVDYRLITADLLVSHRIGGSGLSLLAGPTVGVLMEGRRLDAYVPEWAGFAGAGFTAERSAMNPVRLGIKGGIQYELPATSRVRIIPTLLYDMGLNGIWEMDSWKIDALQFGVDIRIPLD